MWLRLALAVPLVLVGALAAAAPANAAPANAASAKPPVAAAPKPAAAREAVSPARERQRACGAEWRALSPADRTAKGPTWPQFYSKCVKRLKSSKP